MKNYSVIVSVRSLVEMTTVMQSRVPPGMAWVPIRPVGKRSLRQHIKAAWLVLIGRADALVWEHK